MAPQADGAAETPCTSLLHLPRLREREGDIARLTDHFVTRLNERFDVKRRIAPATAAVLGRYDWPGNVRELRHAIEAAMIVCEGDVSPGASAAGCPPPKPSMSSKMTALKAAEVDALVAYIKALK